MGEETVDEIFHALKVIGSLRENERVRTESVPFSIDRTGNFQFLMRWWYNETRMKNIQAVAKVFNDAFSVADMALAKEESYRNIYCGSSRSSHIEQLENWQLLKRSKRELNQGHVGLKSLLVTYKEDTKIVARIELLIEKILEKLEQIDESLSYIKNFSNSLNGKNSTNIVNFLNDKNSAKDENNQFQNLDNNSINF